MKYETDPVRDEIAEWVDVWECQNFRLTAKARCAIVDSVSEIARGGEHNGRELPPMSTWRLSGVVQAVLHSLKEGAMLFPCASDRSGTPQATEGSAEYSGERGPSSDAPQ